MNEMVLYKLSIYGTNIVANHLEGKIQCNFSTMHNDNND